MKEDLSKKGFETSSKTTNYSIDLVPEIIKINLKKELVVLKGDSSKTFENFDDDIGTSLYSIINIAREIINEEAVNCDFDSNYFMLLYPSYDIKKIPYRESKLYEITERDTGLRFKFAVRSCVIPPGVLA